MTDDELRTEIVALRNRLADLERRLATPDIAPEPGTDRRVSRRGLLAAAVAGGAGLAAAQVAGAPSAAAAPGGALLLGQANTAGSVVTQLTASPSVENSTLFVANPQTPALGFSGFAVFGQLGSASRLAGSGGAGYGAVCGDSTSDSGVLGCSANSSGTVGISRNSHGVAGRSEQDSGVFGTTEDEVAAGVEGYATGTGVLGRSDSGTGVSGTTTAGDAVLGVATSGKGVHGISTGSDGVYGRSTAGTGVHAYSSSGTGVQATGDGSLPGVDAASRLGYGVQARGARAPLRLVPSTKVTGPPTTGSHQPGELFADKAGGLYFCTAAGTPGTWKKVTLG